MQFSVGQRPPVDKILWPEESVFKATGGFTLDRSTLKEGTEYLEKGAPIAANYATRVAKLVKTAKVVEAAAVGATAYKVGKNHHFKVGNIVAKTKGGKAHTITAIDTSDLSFDILTLDVSIDAVSVGDVLWESSTAGTAVAAEANVPNGILIHLAILEESTGVNIGLRIYEIQEANLPFAISAYNKAALSDRFLFI
jgi:hypothetical protein